MKEYLLVKNHGSEVVAISDEEEVIYHRLIGYEIISLEEILILMADLKRMGYDFFSDEYVERLRTNGFDDLDERALKSLYINWVLGP